MSRPSCFLPVALLISLSGVLPLEAQDAAGPLPWEREKSLLEGAGETFITSELSANDPQPGVKTYPRGKALHISNPSIRSTLWGPVDGITISVLKNDIWDRRVAPVKFTSPTLEEIIRGANSPINKDASDINPKAASTRPASWGYLREEGGKFNPYLDLRYPFPSAKPTGQIILNIAALKGAPQPELKQNCANGVVSFTAGAGGDGAELDYLLSMTRNIYAIRGKWTGADTTAALRLYRHRDTSHYTYMTEDGKAYREGKDKPRYEAQKSWNGAVPAPTSGQDGEFFWIRQSMPAEKTFPAGFDYVLMGLRSGDAALSTAENERKLGTPVPDKNITAAPGAAATASFPLKKGGEFTTYAVVVTSIDAQGGDIMAVAKQRLQEAAQLGFDGLVKENAAWYADLYQKRENGRIFAGTGTDVSDSIPDIFNSWFCDHDGGTKTDMRKYQASASYVVPERDNGMYGSLPCYNEVFYTPDAVRNRLDATLMWKHLVEHWAEASKANARETYGMPGMYLTHGFLPPIKADKYVHTNVALELAVETMAQVYRTLWDEWDYTGDRKVLEEIYPYMREMALFYAAYAKKGEDGIYHIIPSVQEESWGLQPKFSHNKDTIAAITMFRWALTRAAEGARLLGRDADLIPQWLEVAKNLPAYPTWDKPEGRIYAAIPGIEPWRGKGEHPWDIGTYPAVLSDSVNLDSDPETREIMARTAKLLPAALSGRAIILVGENPQRRAPRRNDGRSRAPVQAYIENPERLLNSRSGRIHLFPVLVPEAGPLAFRNFQASGGFLVSASRDESKVTHVEIESRRDIACRVMNPWPGKKITVTEKMTGSAVSVKMDTVNGECAEFPTKQGGRYTLRPGA